MSYGNLITWDEMRARGWKFSEAQTDRMIAKGRFPKPVRYSGAHRRTPTWRHAEVLPFLRRPHLAKR
jgi:predicted DNA-binding transcriptional regulator AlpA